MKFKVTASELINYECNVEAESYQHAREVFYKTLSEDINNDCVIGASFDIDSVEKLSCVV